MKKEKELSKANYFFVDESGDPNFYNSQGKLIVGNEGCSKILLLGFIKTENPELIRKSIAIAREEIAKDTYLSSIPSVSKSIRSFHAKDDCPEVREKFFKAIINMDFKAFSKSTSQSRRNTYLFFNTGKQKQNKQYSKCYSDS